MNNLRVSLLVYTSALSLAVAGLASAQTAPYLVITDGVNKAVISASGSGPVVAFSSTNPGGCSNCMTTGVSAVAGSGIVSWSGTLGTFTISMATGQTKPAVTSPVIDMGLGEVDSTAPGTLSVYWTDTGFSGVGPTSATATTDFFAGTGNSSSYLLLINNSNLPYGAFGYTGVQSVSIPASMTSGNKGGVTVGNGVGPTSNPFSMTIAETLTFGSLGSMFNDDSFNALAGQLQPPPPSTICHGDAATIGFWNNKNGQAIILSLNGGSTSTALASWLSSQFPLLYGSLAGGTNATVAAYFQKQFGVKGTKTYAQILAGALATYVTSTALSGTDPTITAERSTFGFNSSSAGTGAKTYNTGSYGTAVGLLNNQSYTVLQLLEKANLDSPLSAAAFNAFNSIFNGINTTGDIQ